MNSVIISGRLTRDPDKKTSGSGKEFVTFSVAVDKYSKDKEKRVIYVDCIAFNHPANFVSKYCKKGSKVTISGELDSRTVDRDGVRTTYWSVVVNEVEAYKPNEGMPFEV